MMQDLRYALRSLGLSMGFTVAAVLTLALGVAANTVVYSMFDALYLRPLPFGDRSLRLVTLHSTHPTQAQDWDDSELSYPDLVDLRESSVTLEGIEGVVNRNLSVSAIDDTVRVLGASITPGLFQLLGVSPHLGRAFQLDEGAEPGAESVAILSYSLWQRLYGADRTIVGRTVPVNGRRVTVVGVMPQQFAFPELCEIWLPYRTLRDQGRDRRIVLAVGLRRPDADLDATLADVRRIGTTLAVRYPDTNRDWNVHVMPMREFFVGKPTDMTAVLLAVGLVLLVACANVASLLVARGIGRQRELIVRTALGASRTRLVRLMMFESLLLAAAGGAIGLLVAGWGLDGLVASMPEPPPYWARIRIDARVLLFTFFVSLVTAVVSGLLPALRVSRVKRPGSLLIGSRSADASPDQRRLQGTLVAAQVAVSFGLLVSAALLALSSRSLLGADVGFDPRPLFSVRVYLAGDASAQPEARAHALNGLLARLSTAPGVSSAAATGAIPSDDGGVGIRLVPARGTGAPGEEIGAQQVPVTPGLFDALGLRLLEGRTFTTTESVQPQSDVVIVNQHLAKQFWPGEGAVGRQLRVVQASGIVSYRVVGVVPDVVYEELGEETPQSQLTVYVPYAVSPWRTMAILLRTPGDPAALAHAARRIVREADPNFASYDVMTMWDRRLMTSWGERLEGRTFAAFAAAALLLACLGIYGLTAYTVAQRTREIGVRLAIGAAGADILRLLLGRGLKLALIGGIAGVPLAIAGARMVQDDLFRVSPWTPAVWIVLPAVLVSSVVLASFIPARRATLIDPATALRQD